MTKFCPPVKISQLRSNISGFKQEDCEPVALVWDRMKEAIRNCPNHGMEEWRILHLFLLCFKSHVKNYAWHSCRRNDYGETNRGSKKTSQWNARKPCSVACGKVLHQKHKFHHWRKEWRAYRKNIWIDRSAAEDRFSLRKKMTYMDGATNLLYFVFPVLLQLDDLHGCVYTHTCASTGHRDN